MQRFVPLWQWVVIVFGLFVLLIGVGSWVYNRIAMSRALPPASPKEAVQEYQEQVLGYPARQPTSRPTAPPR